jgi:fused signal recognition particle receptor
MFDGLKDKLSSFSSDVEEEADLDEVDDADLDEVDDADLDEDEQRAFEDADEPELEPAEDRADTEGVETDADGEGAEADHEGPKADAGPAAGPAAPAEDAVGAESDEVEAAADDAAADDEGEKGGRGLTERAKLFATGKTVVDEDDLEPHLDDLEMALLSSDVELGVVQEILDGVAANLTGETRRRLSRTGNLVRDALREALYDVISVGQFDFEERVAAADKPVTIVFTGVNGVGKTTTIAKLARYFEDRGLSTVLANGDTYRAGANEQLTEHAQNLGKKVISHEQGSDPAAVIYDAVEYAEANDVDVVLGDTAGRLHTSDDLMDQLSKIDRVIEPDTTLFVDEAVAGQDAVTRAREFDAAAEIDGTILTKADADPDGGAAISVAHVTGKPILFLGTGQGYDDLTRFDPEQVVDELLGEA